MSGIWEKCEQSGKKLIRWINLLVIFLRSISKTAIRDGFITNDNVNLQLAQFAPNSGGAIKDKAVLTILSAQQIFPLIFELLKVLGSPSAVTKKIETICAEDISISAAAQLAKLFNKYGSDKSTFHDYHLLYGSILASRCPEQLNILEIGIGTNDTNIVSHMGAKGQPGASLRAFRDFLPNGRIYGADIDSKILFQEERIKTFFVDQTNLNSFNEISTILVNEKFDLIIDDGLHSPNANIATLIFALSNLKPKGWFVVEDISNNSLTVWKVIYSIFPSKYKPFICEAKNGFLFVAQNP